MSEKGTVTNRSLLDYVLKKERLQTVPYLYFKEGTVTNRSLPDYVLKKGMVINCPIPAYVLKKERLQTLPYSLMFNLLDCFYLKNY
jgi:hypothetical protein